MAHFSYELVSHPLEVVVDEHGRPEAQRDVEQLRRQERAPGLAFRVQGVGF